MLEEEKAEAAKQNLIAASYTAWQLNDKLKMSFGSYLKKLGLERVQKISPEQRKIMNEKGLGTAKKINQAMKKCSFRKIDLKV